MRCMDALRQQRNLTTTMAAKGRLLVLGSALQRSPSFHSRGKCVSSLAFDVHSTPATAHHRNILRRQVNPDTESSQASGGTPPLIKDTPRRRQVLEARGVSVVYQRSATAEYRRRIDPAQGSAESAASSKPGGSVVASRSATERHRQQRRAERGGESRQSTRTNPSSLKLPVMDQIMEYENVTSIQTKKETPPANMNTSAIVMAAGAASVLLFASTLVVV